MAPKKDDKKGDKKGGDPLECVALSSLPLREHAFARSPAALEAPTAAAGGAVDGDWQQLPFEAASALHARHPRRQGSAQGPGSQQLAGLPAPRAATAAAPRALHSTG